MIAQVFDMESIKPIWFRLSRVRYYGIAGNYEGLLKFYRYIVITLYKTLTRRSQRAYLTWKR